MDLQDTSLEVTLDIAGNISFQSFLLNPEYFMLNSKYTNKQNIKPVFMHMYPEILTARHITHWYYHGVSFNCILIFNFYIQCNINMVVGVTDCTIFCTLYFAQVYVIKKLRQ